MTFLFIACVSSYLPRINSDKYGRVFTDRVKNYPRVKLTRSISTAGRNFQVALLLWNHPNNRIIVIIQTKVESSSLPLNAAESKICTSLNLFGLVNSSKSRDVLSCATPCKLICHSQQSHLFIPCTANVILTSCVNQNYRTLTQSIIILLIKCNVPLRYFALLPRGNHATNS